MGGMEYEKMIQHIFEIDRYFLNLSTIVSHKNESSDADLELISNVCPIPEMISNFCKDIPKICNECIT